MNTGSSGINPDTGAAGAGAAGGAGSGGLTGTDAPATQPGGGATGTGGITGVAGGPFVCTGTFGLGGLLPFVPIGGSSHSAALGDLNGDGKQDVVTANAKAASVSVLLGKGDGTLAARVDYAIGGTPATVALGDLNGDGKLDIVTNAPGGVLFGKGDGSFTARTDDAAGVGGTALALGDLNGDGKLDVVTATCTTMSITKGTVSVRLGIGDGSFAAKMDHGVGLNPSTVALGDLNGDGKLDLVVGNKGTDGGFSLSILLGKGDGTFSASVDQASGGSPSWIMLVDMNGDGKLDIVLNS